LVRTIRRKEKAILEQDEMVEIICKAKYITIAMYSEEEGPYLVTLSHGYDREKYCIYFHCAREGKKIDILTNNNLVWGQAIVDLGYVQGACDHLYATTQFQGKVMFIEDLKEKEHALNVMIHGLEENPTKVIEEQIDEKSLKRVHIGRIDIEYMTGKRSKDVVIST
jgi:nitroimidazol reductase NimA-like FMN-containing flavoprotein (pyridoxamine 5'-phosphate oxidase superfamily)